MCLPQKVHNHWRSNTQSIWFCVLEMKRMTSNRSGYVWSPYSAISQDKWLTQDIRKQCQSCYIFSVSSGQRMTLWSWPLSCLPCFLLSFFHSVSSRWGRQCVSSLGDTIGWSLTELSSEHLFSVFCHHQSESSGCPFCMFSIICLVDGPSLHWMQRKAKAWCNVLR